MGLRTTTGASKDTQRKRFYPNNSSKCVLIFPGFDATRGRNFRWSERPKNTTAKTRALLREEFYHGDCN